MNIRNTKIYQILTFKIYSMAIFQLRQLRVHLQEISCPIQEQVRVNSIWNFAAPAMAIETAFMGKFSLFRLNLFSWPFFNLNTIHVFSWILIVSRFSTYMGPIPTTLGVSSIVFIIFFFAILGVLVSLIPNGACKDQSSSVSISFKFFLIHAHSESTEIKVYSLP